MILVALSAVALGIGDQRCPALGDARGDAVERLLEHIEPGFRLQCGMMLRGKAFTFSQAWQDWYIFHNYFRDCLSWGQGAYVDIGSNDPLHISNTLFFDKCLGWRGICFEMQERYWGMTQRTRNCTLIPRCVFGHKTRASMTRSGGGATLVPGQGNMECAIASEVIPNTLGPGARVDFMSIDIEGSEREVLRCMNFSQLGVDMVLMETNKRAAIPDLRDIDFFFHKQGFANVETFLNQGLWLDNLYVRGPAPPIFPSALDKPIRSEGDHFGPTPLRRRTNPAQASFHQWLFKTGWSCPARS